MALAYTAPTWTNGSGEGISASNLQAISNCLEGLVQGTDKSIHNISFSGSTMTLTFADGSQETLQTTVKGISSIAKTGTSGLVDTYTITFSDGTTTSYQITNGAQGAQGPQGEQGEKGDKGDKGDTGNTGATPNISMTATADATSSASPSVTVTKTGTAEAPAFALAFSGLKGTKGDTGSQGATGPAGADGADGADGVSPEVTITTITGGHRVKITDADHPSGQTFDVMDGTGAGDMLASIYDALGAVASAGGIPSYVSGAITDKTDKVNGATNGNFAGLDSNGNLTDSGSKASDFKAASAHDAWSDVTNKPFEAVTDGLAIDSGNNLVTYLQEFERTGTASATAVSYQRIKRLNTWAEITGSKYMERTNTSATTYTFTNNAITTSSVIDVYTDTYGDNPSNVSVSNGSCTVTFAQSKSRTVRIYIK